MRSAARRCLAAFAALALIAAISPIVLAAERKALALDRIELRMGERIRRCQVYLPEGWQREQSAPLVLLLHGAGGNGKWQIEYSGLDAKADEAGFVLASPDGTGRLGRWMLTWNAGDCCGYASNRDVDDVEFLERLLDEIVPRYNLDPKRVYVVGLSNGGMMAYRLADRMPGRFAAMGIVSGTHLGDAPSLDVPVPVVHFHGTEDRLVPFDGGSDRTWHPTHGFRSARATAMAWASANGCPLEPEHEVLPDRHDDGTSISIERFGPGREGAEVALYVIAGGGHTWPGRSYFSRMEAPRWVRRASPLGRSTEEIAANDVLWEFFRRHVREAEPAWASAPATDASPTPGASDSDR